MGVDYSVVGGVGIATELVADDINIQMVETILESSPFEYDMYGNGYREGEERIAIVLPDDTELDDIPELAKELQQLCDDNGIKGKVGIFSELHIW